MATALDPPQDLDELPDGARVEVRLPIRTERDLSDFLLVAFGVRIPKRAVCPGHAAPWAAFCNAYFARAPVSVWKGSRGLAGKTHTLSLLSLVEAVTLAADVNLLGGSGQQSARVLEAMRTFWNHDNAPTHVLASAPAALHTVLRNGARLNALMASQRSVRGPHPQRLRMDEVDEMELSILDAAMGQPMARADVDSQVVLSSTHQYADGTMSEVLKRATERKWPVFEWCYRETLEPHGWLSQAEVARKRQMVSDEMWRVEFELQEPNPENRAINTEAVASMFRRSLGTFDGANNELVQIEPPLPHGRYAHGADWAKDRDWTVMCVIRTDVDPMRVVAFRRMGRQPWPVMVNAFGELLDRFPGEAAHDGTGVGDVVSGYLDHLVEDFTMVGRKRTDLLTEYIAAVERKELVSPFIKFMEREHRMASTDDFFGSGHLPDSICAMALAYRATGRGFRPEIS